MHFKLTVLFIFLLAGKVFSQQKAIDSLQLQLSVAKTETAKVNILWALSKEYASHKPDSALLIAQKGLFIARKNNDIIGQMLTLKQMADVYQFTGNYSKSLSLYLERLKLDEKQKDVERMVVTLISIGNLYQMEGDYKNALLYAKRAEVLIENNNIADSKWDSYLSFGDLYEKMDSLSKSFSYNERALRLALYQKDSALIGMSLNNSANIYLKAGRNDTALLIYYRGIPYLEQTQNESFLCETYQGIASILLKKGKQDSALVYACKSLQIANKAGYDKKYITSCILLTNLYKSAHLIDSAFIYQDKMIAMKDAVYSQESIKKLENLTIEEKLRQNELEAAFTKAQEDRARNLQLLSIGVLIPLFFLSLLFLSKRKIKAKVIEFAGILSLLLMFEYITLLLHPKIVEITNDSPFLEILILVAIAAVLTPSHHRIEKWMLLNLTKPKQQKISQPINATAGELDNEENTADINLELQ